MDVQAVTPFVNDADFTLYVGDVRDCLRELPEGSVHTVVTSPPYWGLRDYGTGSWEGGDPDCDHTAVRRGHGDHEKQATSAGTSRDRIVGADCRKCGATRVDQQIGLEPTPEAFVAAMVDVFREVRRVLRDDGTLWLNLGDSYATRWGSVRDEGRAGLAENERGRNGAVPSSLKEKDLVGIPWRVAFALQADGWYLRSDIIWAKPNPMPESVTDRPTKAHEYLFLLSKHPRYYFDQEAVREPHSPDGRKVTVAVGRDGSLQHRDGERWPNGGRNIRSVWEIATQPYPEAHFATFPEALPDRCIRAGTSERGCCPECGAPWGREVARVPTGFDGAKYGARAVAATGGAIGGGTAASTLGSGNGKLTAAHKTVGWRMTCTCRVEQPVTSGDMTRATSSGPVEPIPCTVLDPFMGSGTTALVARRLGRRSIGIELNEEYARLCARRLQQQSLFAEAAS